MPKAQKTEALTVAQTMAVVPDFIKTNDRRGSENITTKDIRLPALKLAQSMTPETKRSESSYIDGLTEGDFFDPVSREIFGGGPLRFIVLKYLGHRNIEFAPMKEGGGIIDADVPDDDPRARFSTKEEDGKTVKVRPVATKFYDYLILLLPDDGRQLPMTLSFKGTQLKRGVWLNTILNGTPLAAFAQVFTAEAVPEKRGTYSFYGWKLAQGGWPSEEIYHKAEELFEIYNDSTVTVVDTDNDEPAARNDDNVGDDVPF